MTPRRIWNFHDGNRLLFGPGASDETGVAARRAGMSRPLVVTDPVLERCGLVEPILASLREAGLEPILFTGGAPEPSFEITDRALASARSARPDGVIGLGGGSNMDLAKVVAVGLSHPVEFRTLFGFDQIPGPLIPLMCIPTTAGTGSEVSHSAVLTDTENRIKLSMQSQHLRPRVALVDPLLTLGCPRKPSADSGIDTLTHAIEAFTNTRYSEMPTPPRELAAYEGKNPMGDLLAERAIRLVGRHLVRSVEQLDSLPDREGMAFAATLAGLAFSNCGVALVHAMEYPVGGAVHCSHGEGNGLLLPFVMQFTRRERVAEFASLAEFLGEDVAALTPEAAADRAIEAVVALKRRIGIPERLRDLGVTEAMLPEFAAKAYGIKRLMTTTPGQPSEADVLAIYRAAW